MILRIKKKQLIAKCPPAAPAGTPASGLSRSPLLRPATRRPPPWGAGRRNSGGAPESRRKDAFSPSHGNGTLILGATQADAKLPAPSRRFLGRCSSTWGQSHLFGVGVCLGLFVCLFNIFPRFLSRRCVCLSLFPPSPT